MTAVLTGILCWSAVALAAGCDANDPFLVDVINVICALTSLSLGGGGDCIMRTDTCFQTTPQLFTGVTLGSPSVADPQWCELGGRGQIMGEAALCLLRDLAQPALPPSEGGPGSHGITISTPPISLGPLGDAQVTQRVGFLSFDVDNRMMRGFHDVSLCLPAFGCVKDQTQQFSARLIQGGSGGHCGDYPIETGHALDMVVADAEHTLSTSISPIVVYTPFGPVSAEPQFDFDTALKLVTPPYGGEPPTVRSVRAFFPFPPELGGCKSNRALLQDVLQGAVLGEGILLTAAGGGPASDLDDSGQGWDSQLALGGRDADPASPLWMFNPSDKTRPDLDQRQARKADEKKFVGHASASVPIVYDPSKLLPAALNQSPFHVELNLSVTPAVKSSFASQFNVYLAEGSFRLPIPAPSDCNDAHFDDARLLFQSRVDADAAFTLTINFHFLLEIHLDLPFVGDVTIPLIEVNEPIVPVMKSDRQPKDGPSAEATSELSGATSKTVPPASPGYTTFTSFSGGAVDGAAFVEECLTRPPPSPQPLPQPAYVPGDPVKLVATGLYPCNLCIAVDTLTSVCVPKAGFPSSQPCQGINGTCVDASGMNGCENQAVSPPLHGSRTVLFPVSQADLPAGKQWLCDDASKLGCYDLCTYDPAASTPLVVSQSAVDLSPGLNCNLQPQGGDCGSAADCDDQNPCTNDLCEFQGEFKMCRHTAHDGVACDDGLFCDGADTCFLGACSQHTGNPCAGGGDAGCCDESAASCRQSCAATLCGDGIIQFGEQCDDGNAAGADGCSANCTVETGFVCTGQPSLCAPLGVTPTPRRTPAAAPVPVIPSAATPAGLLLIGVLIWCAYRAMRTHYGPAGAVRTRSTRRA